MLCFFGFLSKSIIYCSFKEATLPEKGRASKPKARDVFDIRAVTEGIQNPIERD